MALIDAPPESSYRGTTAMDLAPDESPPRTENVLGSAAMGEDKMPERLSAASSFFDVTKSKKRSWFTMATISRSASSNKSLVIAVVAPAPSDDDVDDAVDSEAAADNDANTSSMRVRWTLDRLTLAEWRLA